MVKLSLNAANANIRRHRPKRVLQFGAGNFLRGFVGRMFHEMNEAEFLSTDILVVKPTSSGDYNKLREQDGLYYVITSGIENGEVIDRHQLITTLAEIINPYRDWTGFLATACRPEIRFVISNTTEAGIRYVAEPYEKDTCPVEFPAKLTRWLYERFKHFQGDAARGCIILPCELLPDNGRQLKAYVIRISDDWALPKSFVSWVDQSCDFCNTLVDQIIPGKPNPGDPRVDKLPFRDELTTTAEPYHIWVIDGPDGLKKELPLPDAGLNVVFTNDIAMYRKRKILILNGAHTSMVPVGLLSGVRTVGDVMGDPLLNTFVERLVYDEIIPSLDLDHDMLVTYAGEVLDRFRNPFIEHKLMTISLNSVPKARMRLLPTILDYSKEKGIMPRLMCLSFTALLVFYSGEYKGIRFQIQDSPETLNFFTEIWHSYQSGSRSLRSVIVEILGRDQFWGMNLSLEHDLVSVVLEFAEGIIISGMTETLREAVRS